MFRQMYARRAVAGRRPELTALALAFVILGSSVRLPDPAVTTTVFEDPAAVRAYQAVISANNLSRLLHEFASDEFAGRETGTDGQRLAAHFLAAQHASMGLKPPPGASGNGSERYFQKFDLYGYELRAASITFTAQGETRHRYTYLPEDPGTEMYLAAGTISSLEGPIEFRGSVSHHEGIDYEDYAILYGRQGADPSTWNLSFAPEDLLQPAESEGPYRSTITWPKLHLHVRLSPNEPMPLGYLLVASNERVATEARLVAEVALSVGRLASEPGAEPYSFPPVYVVTPEIADALLESTGVTVADLRALEARDGAEARLPLKGVHIASHIDFPVRTFETENVVAYIEGSDPKLKNEHIVLSAHYDHLGVNPLLEGDRIFNGADDNGSGNVALLEIASAFMEAKRDGLGPRRSLVFLHFTGEEKGLLGSKYYTDADPLFPLEETVANFNMDMIGRIDPSHPDGLDDYVYVIGSRLISHELHLLNEEVNRVTGIDIVLDERFNTTKDPNRFYRRSDHWNFGKNGVPFIFFFTGSHEDYHRPGDEAHKVDYDRMARIARLIFGTTWQVANQDDRPAFDGEGLN